MRNISQLLIMMGVSIVIAYICIYLIGFNDFDDSKMGIYFQGDDFEIHFHTIMIRIGLAFSISLLGFLLLRKKNTIFAHFIAVICSIVSILILFRSVSQAQDARLYTIFAKDKVCEFHCNVVIVMSYVITILLLVYWILLICNVIYRMKTKAVVSIEVACGMQKRKSYVHIFVLVAFVCVVVGCNFYNNRINRSSTYEITDIMLDSILDFVILGLPATLILGTAVKEWIQNKRYIKSIAAYAVYMYVAYCIIFRLYNRKLNMQIDAFNSVDYMPRVICLYMINVAVVILYLAIKMVKSKRKSVELC